MGSVRTPCAVLQVEFAGAADSRTGEEKLQEAIALTEALGVEVVLSELVRIATLRPPTLIGQGKISELAPKLSALEVELLIVNGSLTPVQQQNLEKAWKVKILDRTGLILEIFSARARTREGALQVELAHLTYQRSRLVRSWTHLERQRGGLGFVGGPGESQLEADRRMIDERILKIKRQLEKVVGTRTLQRASRQKIPFPVVALAGYTNAGKSTLFNRMTKAEVPAKDMLFATLDPTMRQISTPGGMTVILSDTVGFIADLPTELIAAFRATLEEVLEAELIIHVHDVSAPEHEEQAQDVNEVLTTLGIDLDTEEIIQVYNKIDLLDAETRAAWQTRAAREPRSVVLSAVKGEGIAALEALIEDTLAADFHEIVVSLPSSEGEAIAWLHNRGAVMHRQPAPDAHIGLLLRISEADLGRFRSYFPELARLTGWPIPTETD